MGTVPGPIISFRFSTEDVSSAIAPAFQQVRQQSQSVSNAIAEDWKRMAAQIRASIAQGASSEKEILSSRTQLLGVLDRQISGYAKLNELSAKELSSLKAVTLERERQADAIKRGGVGLTAGTSQVSQQTILGVERVLDSVINRYFGGAAGAAARTLRDVSYYANQANGGTGSGGILSGFTGGASSLFSNIPASTIAASGLAAAFAALGIAAAASAHALVEQNSEIKNTAAITGLSTRQVQVYSEAAKLLGLDAATVTVGLSRLQAQLGDFVIRGKEAGSETGKFVSVLHRYGVEVTDSSNRLRPAGQILGDFAAALKDIPDQATRTAIALDALGGRNRELASLLLRTDVNFNQLTSTIDRSGLVIDVGLTRSLDKGEESLRNFELQADVTKQKIREFLAEGFFKGVNVIKLAFQSITNPDQYEKDRTARNTIDIGAELSRLRPGQSAAGALQTSVQQYYDNLAQGALHAQQVIAAGGEQEFKLAEMRKEYEEDLKQKRTEDAAILLKQINETQALLELEKKRAEQADKIHRLFNEFTLTPPTGSLAGARGARSNASALSQFYNPSGGVDPLSLGIDPLSIGFGQNPLAGIIGPAAKSPLDAAGLLAQINKEHEDLFRSQASIDAEHYQDELDSLNDALKQQLISQQEYSAAVIKLNQDRNKTLSDADKKYEDEAGSIFDDLISGKTKNLGQKVAKDVEDILLKPLKDAFSKQLGGIFDDLANTVKGGTSPSGSGTTPTSGGWLGKVLGKLGAAIGIGGTPGTFPGAIGSGPGGGVGQNTISTPLMNVAAQVVNIATLGLGAGGSGNLVPGGIFGGIGGSGGFGSFFGNTNPFGNSVLPAGTSGIPNLTSGSALTNLFSKLSPFAAGAALLGVGAATGNESAMALGAASLAGKAATVLSGVGSLPAGLASALGTFGAAAPGIGLAASGIITAYQSKSNLGKAGGAAESVGGGALAGAVIGSVIPGIGTAIGAGIGAIVGAAGGIIASIFGGPSNFQQGIQNAMYRNQYHAPLSENFSFASNGSIANTLQTGFQQNGSIFSQYTLPANTPFYASALTGKLTWQQLYRLQNSGLNPNAPFLGNPSVDPYAGQGPVGKFATPTNNAAPIIHLHIPGLIDANQVAATLQPHLTSIAQMVNRQASSSSSGSGSTVRRLAFLP